MMEEKKEDNKSLSLQEFQKLLLKSINKTLETPLINITPQQIEAAQLKKKKRPPNVCIDFDGVLSDNKGKRAMGEPFPGARAFMIDLCKIARVWIYSSRIVASDDILKKWFAEHDIPYDWIWIGQGKPCAAAYIDDRAVPCRPVDGQEEYKKAYAKTWKMING